MIAYLKSPTERLSDALRSSRGREKEGGQGVEAKRRASTPLPPFSPASWAPRRVALVPPLRGWRRAR